MSRVEEAAASLAVPSGINGKQRAAYLELTDTQKTHYRYHFVVMGQPAAICLGVAPRESGCWCTPNA